MKYAVHIERCFDTVEFHPTYKTGSKKEIEKYIEDIKSNPEQFQEQMRKEEQFLFYPSIELKEHEPKSHPKDKDCIILATVRYEYTTRALKNNQANPIPVIAITICSLIILFAVFVLQFAKQAHEKGMINDACYMYTKNGVPDRIEIMGTVYRMDPDGTLNDEDLIFLNPYHQMELAKNQCIKVNVKE